MAVYFLGSRKRLDGTLVTQVVLIKRDFIKKPVVSASLIKLMFYATMGIHVAGGQDGIECISEKKINNKK